MRDSSGSFGSANAEAVFNGNVTAVPTAVTDKDATIPSSTADKIDGYLDNLATEEINERDVLNRLFDKNERLATTNATTLAKKGHFLPMRQTVVEGQQHGQTPRRPEVPQHQKS